VTTTAPGGGTRTPTVVARTRAELAEALAGTRSRGGRVTLVPTMGALHAGHAALVATARASSPDPAAVVVSIFVNPLQFGPGEDLDRYPRTFEADLALCAEQGADVVFAPSVEEVYPGGDPQVTVEPGPLGTVLEGATRPGHYRGVLTVVAKLFGLVRPDAAVFGEKDYQQLVLVARMSDDLCMGVEVVGAETVREAGGLALSSRNAYLTSDQRTAARALSRALSAGAAAGAAGEHAVLASARAVLDAEPGVDLDYLALTSPGLTEPPPSGAARLLVAARVGSTRLIDNVAVRLGDSGVVPGDATR
jgi:pantoate--beta-alanine ligase